MKRLTVTLDAELDGWVEDRAGEDENKSEIIRRALRQYREEVKGERDGRERARAMKRLSAKVDAELAGWVEDQAREDGSQAEVIREALRRYREEVEAERDREEQTPVSREEFQALERRVAELELSVRRGEADDPPMR